VKHDFAEALGFRVGRVYYLSESCGSAGGGVSVDAEQVGQLLLLGAGVGEHASGAGAAFAAVVEQQHGFLDAGQGGQQLTHGQVQAGSVALELFSGDAAGDVLDFAWGKDSGALLNGLAQQSPDQRGGWDVLVAGALP